MVSTIPPNFSKADFESIIRRGPNNCGDENLSMSMVSIKKRSAGEMSIGCCSSESQTPLKTRKLSASYATSSVSSNSSSPSSNAFRYLVTLPRRSNSPESIIPVLSPCTYLAISLKNKKIKSRVDSFNLEQALYFEPFQESEIHMDLLRALRAPDLEKLRSLMTDAEKSYDFEARNQFGENLAHLACRMGTLISVDMLKFLVEDAKVPLNVRDKFGRTPLHNACMLALPNFNNIDYVLKTEPKLTVFEDDKNKVPFELIPQRCFERWTRFMSEKNILKYLCLELSKHEGLLQEG